jgi:hypothetical protein
VTTAFKSSTFTSEFGQEFEVERMAWLRRRFLWYMGVSVALSVAAIVSAVVQHSSTAFVLFLFELFVQLLGVAAHIGAFAYVWRHRNPRIPVLTIVYWLILGLGALVILSGPIVIGPATEEMRHAIRENDSRPHTGVVGGIPVTVSVGPDKAPDGNRIPETEQNREERELIERNISRIGAGFMGVWIIFGSHFFACVFLPWTPRESLRPVLPLIALNAIIAGGYTAAALIEGPFSWAILATATGLIVSSALMPLPGMAVCWWRHGRFRKRFTFDTLRGRYTELRAELTNARQIHEALFPKSCPEGPVRFSYVYEPMRQIGGDYLYACFTAAASGAAALNVVVIDVTGHGIPAALTVNRLHGELERIFAEDPQAGPGDVLQLLNRYVHLTLATHSVYVTAICFRADPIACTLEYASGGHPPAFLRAVDGTVEQLDSTTFVLGACGASEFKPEPRTLRFLPGDALIAYTDGATEARDTQGKFLGISGIQKMIALGRPDEQSGWCGAILDQVEQYRHGPAADDTLVIEIVRPLQSDTAQAARSASRASAPV